MLLDFNEFVKSIDLNEFAEKIDSLNTHEIFQIENANDPRVMVEFVKRIYQKSVEDAHKVCLLTLNHYHNWLQE